MFSTNENRRLQNYHNAHELFISENAQPEKQILMYLKSLSTLWIFWSIQVVLWKSFVIVFIHDAYISPLVSRGHLANGSGMNIR